MNAAGKYCQTLSKSLSRDCLPFEADICKNGCSKAPFFYLFIYPLGDNTCPGRILPACTAHCFWASIRITAVVVWKNDKKNLWSRNYTILSGIISGKYESRMASPRRPGEPKLLGNISVVCCEYTSCCCGLTVVILLDWVVEISRMTKAEIVSENSPKYTLFFFFFFLGWGGGGCFIFFQPQPSHKPVHSTDGDHYSNHTAFNSKQWQLWILWHNAFSMLTRPSDIWVR